MRHTFWQKHVLNALYVYVRCRQINLSFIHEKYMNFRLYIMLISALNAFSLPIVGMPAQERNPVYQAVCAYNLADLIDLFLSAPHIALKYVNIPDNYGQTALHRAVITEQTTIVHILLKNGADCNSKDTFRRTPLHHAVISRNAEIVELLLMHGASIHHSDRATHTPLYYAETFRCPEIVNIMSRYK